MEKTIFDIEEAIKNTEKLILSKKYGLLSEEDYSRLLKEHDLRNKILNAFFAVISTHFSLKEAQECEIALKSDDMEKVSKILFEAGSKITNFQQLFSEALIEVEKTIIVTA